MKYVFFHKKSFGDDSLWIIIDEKIPHYAKIRSKDGSITTHTIGLDDAINYVKCDIWTMRKYITR